MTADADVGIDMLVEFLTELELSDSPPCECCSSLRTAEPAVARVHKMCPCGRDVRFFIGAECLELLREGVLRCRICFRPSNQYKWSYT